MKLLWHYIVSFLCVVLLAHVALFTIMDPSFTFISSRILFAYGLLPLLYILLLWFVIKPRYPKTILKSIVWILFFCGLLAYLVTFWSFQRCFPLLFFPLVWKFSFWEYIAKLGIVSFSQANLSASIQYEKVPWNCFDIQYEYEPPVVSTVDLKLSEGNALFQSHHLVSLRCNDFWSIYLECDPIVIEASWKGISMRPFNSSEKKPYAGDWRDNWILIPPFRKAFSYYGAQYEYAKDVMFGAFGVFFILLTLFTISSVRNPKTSEKHSSSSASSSLTTTKKKNPKNKEQAPPQKKNTNIKQDNSSEETPKKTKNNTKQDNSTQETPKKTKKNNDLDNNNNNNKQKLKKDKATPQ